MVDSWTSFLISNRTLKVEKFFLSKLVMRKLTYTLLLPFLSDFLSGRLFLLADCLTKVIQLLIGSTLEALLIELSLIF